jgi:hypothetical protein
MLTCQQSKDPLTVIEWVVMPCDKATLATEALGSAHSTITWRLNSVL